MAESAKEFFDGMKENLDPEKIKGINATYQWDITGAGKWYAKFSDDSFEVSEGEADSSDITITVEEQNWLDIVDGKLNPQMAFMTGKLKVQGDMTLAMKLQGLVG